MSPQRVHRAKISHGDTERILCVSVAHDLCALRFLCVDYSDELLPRRADRDPAANDLNLTVCQIRWAVARHAPANDRRGTLQFLNQITAVGISGNDPDGSRLSADRCVHEL